MFEIIFHDIIFFRQIIEVIKDLISQVCIFVSKEGLEIQTLDPALISMTYLSLTKEAFQLMHCPEPCNIGVDLETFSKLLKCSHCTSDSCCKFVYDGRDTLTISITDANSNRDFNANLRLMDIDVEYRKMNADFEKYDCKAKLNAADFYEVFRDLSQFSKDINIQISDGQIQFTTVSPGEHGEDNIRLTFKNLKHVQLFSRTEKEGERTDERQVVMNNFSLKYLFKMAKSHSISQSVRLFMSNDCCPILISYKFPEKYGTLNFYLAPLLE